jgi:hypothetical protein
MIFNIIIPVFLCIAVTTCLLIIKKSKLINKRRWYMLSIVIVLILYISSFTIIDNSTFSSPEAAFRYQNSEDVMFVVEGEKSAMVVGTEVFNIMLKTDTGWKLDSYSDVERIYSNQAIDPVCFDVYHYKDSNDYYIIVFAWDGCAIDVTDNRNSGFYHSMKTSDASGETIHSYYAYVHDLDDEYTLIVNGEVIPVLDEQN